MPKPILEPQSQQLLSDMTETFLAGHHEWRPDLAYPQSHSDVHGGIMALMKVYEIKRRPLAVELKLDEGDE